MKKLKTLSMMLAVAALTLLPSKGMAQFNWKYKIDGGKIVTEVPQRAAGQQSALLLKTPKLKTVRVAFVGLGMRGPGAVERWTHMVIPTFSV